MTKRPVAGSVHESTADATVPRDRERWMGA